VRLAADANVLLSALVGGRARLVLTSPLITEVLTTEKTLAEVEEYAIVLGRKKKIRDDVLLLALAALPVTVAVPSEYTASLRRARRRIARRAPDDVDILALALQLNIPLWSNDRDFEGTGVELFTTEGLLRKLGLI
jgi:predicted nucleic acid-binding protein